MIRNKTLHILNGQELFNYFKKTHFLKEELIVPFNEAMCYGNICHDPFSNEFVEKRAKIHNVTPTNYAKITLKPLQPLFNEDFKQIALWFDADMFCQINLLTILAWLDRTDYKGTIVLHLVNDKFEPVDYFKLKANGYYVLYKQVLIHKTLPEYIQPAPLKKGVELYLNYLNKESDLMLYIQNHQNVPENELVTALLDKFREYGLGDTQYREIIKCYFEKLNR